MSPGNSQARPIEVCVACALLALSSAVSTYQLYLKPPIAADNAAGDGDLGMAILSVAVGLLLIVLLYLRKNWARLLYAGMLTVSFVIEAIFAVSDLEVVVPKDASYFFHLVLNLAAVVFLFLPASNRWYRNFNWLVR